MREIKFRAWDKENKKIFYDTEVKYRTDLCVTLDGDLTENYIGGDGSYAVEYVNDNYNIMQYTGLKDKNGKEIYEGDIINQCGFFSIGIVRFGTYKRTNFSNQDRQVKHHGFYFEPIPYTDKYNNVRNNNFLSLIEDEERGFEILGNIHQATEEQKKEWGLK